MTCIPTETDGRNGVEAEHTLCRIASAAARNAKAATDTSAGSPPCEYGCGYASGSFHVLVTLSCRQETSKREGESEKEGKRVERGCRKGGRERRREERGRERDGEWCPQCRPLPLFKHARCVFCALRSLFALISHDGFPAHTCLVRSHACSEMGRFVGLARSRRTRRTWTSLSSHQGGKRGSSGVPPEMVKVIRAKRSSNRIVRADCRLDSAAGRSEVSRWSRTSPRSAVLSASWSRVDLPVRQVAQDALQRRKKKNREKPEIPVSDSY